MHLTGCKGSRWRDRRVPLPAFEADDLVAVGLALASAGVLFGFAILHDDAAGALYTYVSRGFWVAGFWAGAGSLYLGILSRWHHAVWLGNGLLWVAYVSMTVGLLIVSWERAPVYLAVFAPFGLFHFLAWLRLGFRQPPPESVVHIVEVEHG